MKTGERVNIKEFGTFTVKERPAGVVTHPQTREKIQVPARKVPHFKASPKLKDEMNQ
jgi:integration host factor subunit beta